MDGDATQVNIDQRAHTSGRKDSTDTEQVTRPQLVCERLNELLKLYEDVCDARQDFNEALKKCGEYSGYDTSALRAHVIAIATDRYMTHQAKVQQQLELFENLGLLQS